jgi:hypothetical protein
MAQMRDDRRLHPPQPGLAADTPPERFHFDSGCAC